VPHLLLVDDEPDILNTLSAVLEREGYAVTTAADYDSVLQLCSRQDFDVVITDLMLDGVERGLDILQAVRYRSAATEVIILTGFASTGSAIQALRDGAFNYLLKPCNLEELKLTVQRALNKQELEQVARHAQHAELARAEAVRARRRMISLFEQAPALIALCRGPRHKLDFANNAFRELLGPAGDDSRDLRSVLPAVGAQRVLDLLDQVRRTRKPYVGREIVVRRPNEGGGAGTMYFNLTLQPTTNDQSRTAGIFVHAVEVTEQVLGRQRISHLAGVLAEQALHDSLTELPNRRLFFDRLEQAIRVAERNRGQVGLLFLDLDGFKQINDTFGHSAGDVVLQRVGAAIQACLRSSDTVARLGGDEFAVLLLALDSRAGAAAVAAKVEARLRRPMHIEGHAVKVRASIGIAVYSEDGRDVAALMRKADSAMYAAKRVDHSRRLSGRRTA
jgi:diguanylate cyclase (GGDEF)-like protein